MSEEFFDFKRAGDEFASAGAWLDKSGRVHIWMHASVFDLQEALDFAHGVEALVKRQPYARANPCQDCGQPCLRVQDGEELPEGLLPAKWRTLCMPCYNARRRRKDAERAEARRTPGTPRRSERGKVAARIALEIQREQGLSWGEIAVRLGRSRDGLIRLVSKHRAEIEADWEREAAEEASPDWWLSA